MNSSPDSKIVVTLIQGIVEHVLAKNSGNQVVIGPTLWQPSDGASTKTWYFAIATADKNGEVRLDCIIEPDSSGSVRLATGDPVAAPNPRPLEVPDPEFPGLFNSPAFQ